MKLKQYLTEMAEQEALQIFGLSPEALGNQVMIKKRHRELVKTYHPDKIGKNAVMAQVNLAYEILKKSKRTGISKSYGKTTTQKGQKLDRYY
jgi:DnaJ-class molecular chaperone